MGLWSHPSGMHRSYTEGTLDTLFFYGTNSKSKNLTVKDLKYHAIIMSCNSLEAMYRKQEKGFKRKGGLYKEKSSCTNRRQPLLGCGNPQHPLHCSHRRYLDWTP